MNMKVENEVTLPTTKLVTVMLLEPYAGKLARTVLRGESSRKGADLLDINGKIEYIDCELDCEICQFEGRLIFQYINGSFHNPTGQIIELSKLLMKGELKDTKSIFCSMVLRLMDTEEYNNNYCKSLDLVLKLFPEIDGELLEKELDRYI